MQMIPVNSSAIRAIGYDPGRRLLKITFEQGDTYDYCNVPHSVFEGILNAYSKGSYYNDYIKDKYPC